MLWFGHRLFRFLYSREGVVRKALQEIWSQSEAGRQTQEDCCFDLDEAEYLPSYSCEDHH